MLTVTPQAEEVGVRVQPGNELVDLPVAVKVGGIGLLYVLDVAVQGLGLGREHAHAHELGRREAHAILVAHVPEVVTLVAEVLKPDPDSLRGPSDHVGRPVVEDLDASELHAGILDVNPVVRDDVAEGANVRLVFELEPVHEKSHGHEVAVGKACGNRMNVCGDGVEGVREVFEGHRAHNGVGLVGATVLATHGRDSALLVGGDARHTSAHDDGAAHGANLAGGLLPELPGTVLGVGEALDKRGLAPLLLLFSGRLGNGVLEDGGYREALHAL